VRELGEQLSALSHSHAEHIAAERQHTRELERSNRFKSEFLANVSHELRTPLNAILLLSKMLADKESGLEGEQRRQAQVIHEASTDLRGMIDNILDISRIEAGQVTMSLEWVDLPSMLEELVNLTEAIFTSKGLRLNLEIASNAPTRLYSDRDKIRQIIKNFLSNAAKFTHHGQVLLTAEAHSDAHYPLAISVSDTGIGIPPGKEEIIFDAFQQADGSTRRRYGGTGLGLSISRELAGLLKGKITVDSALNQGSRFTLELPLSLDPGDIASVEILESHEAPISTHLAPAIEDRDTNDSSELPASDHNQTGHARTDLGDGWVLLLERNIESLLELTDDLKDLGLRVQTAADVDEALETLQEDPACALVMLGALAEPADTCDSITRLREDPACAQLPLIVTGPRDDPAAQRYLASGAAAFCGKPLAADELIALIDRLVSPTSAARDSSDQSSAPGNPSGQQGASG
jgi:nitrogen-specific signal transduction histidine kinase/CheY-like chemotaxis protein